MLHKEQQPLQNEDTNLKLSVLESNLLKNSQEQLFMYSFDKAQIMVNYFPD